MGLKYCVSCGKENMEAMRRCPVCGATAFSTIPPRAGESEKFSKYNELPNQNQATKDYQSINSGLPSDVVAIWPDLFMSFKGRIGRTYFWLGFVTVQVLAVFILVGLGSEVINGWTGLPLLLLCEYAYIAILAKRWHDRNKSGFWTLIGAIPLVGVVWLLVECGFLPGTVGPNQYGTDPLEPS